MVNFHIKNAFIVNEETVCKGDVLISDNFFEKISVNSEIKHQSDYELINAEGLYLFPGVIDTHVHFREPGLTHKANIREESKAAVAGGITSFMDMPNTIPPVLTQDILEEKFKIASGSSLANYSFYMGVSNENTDEVLKTPLNEVCGIKIFLDSCSGNLLVDNIDTLNKIFSESPHIIAVHCEDAQIIAENTSYYKNKYGDAIPINLHDKIRSVDACKSSSCFAVNLAKKHNTKLHLLHISTEDELSLLCKNKPLEEKRITGEVCIHHLWFSNDDYETLGSKIKCNPAIKEKKHREALRKAISYRIIDVISSDHAPHLWEEKQNPYTKCPSGAPVIQFMLPMIIELYKKKIITLSLIPQLLAHNPAIVFNISKRGFIKENYFADCVLVNMNKTFKVDKNIIHSKCNWSPVEGFEFSSTVEKTFVNGHLAFDNGRFDETIKGKRLLFARE